MKSLLTPMEYELLLHLNKSTRELYIYELSRRINRTYSATGAKVNDLKKMGLVKCNKNLTDKKKIMVSLSPKGEEVVRLLYKIKNVLSLNDCSENLSY